MYLRKDLVNNKYYYRIVKSFRSGNKVKQKTVLNLGTIEMAYLKLRDNKVYSHFLDVLNFNNKKLYKTFYADPPWFESGGGKIKRGADKHYELMKTHEIIEMGSKIKSLSCENAHLYLWVTNNFLEDGLKVAKEWGFRFVTKITWIKGKINENGFQLNNPGLGQYFRGLDEICLFCVRGSLPLKKAFQTVLISPRRKHSQKPLEMYKIIETVSYAPFIELFARDRHSRSWDIWGNENLTNDVYF
jgi:N6-adenosine-specific RNA methylase IME4